MPDEIARIRERIMVIRSYPCVGYWRRRARVSILASVERAIENDLDIELTIQEEYPFGERANYPYTVWLDERWRIRDWIRGTNSGPEIERRRWQPVRSTCSGRCPMPDDRLLVECVEVSHPTLAGALSAAAKLTAEFADDLSIWDVTVGHSDEDDAWLVAVYRRTEREAPDA